ncbi:GTP pyrophosphokinase [Metapseudomonas otitidis]|uniref:GTP pyrophosphokinase n=1 Tax=Metapseudomonas otitidis TaxID=319939 RepID=UPI000D1BBB0B|nr:GTP pyrophosphokinase [Pseudomonas otitidis]
MNTPLETAIALACRVHAGQRDKAGRAYVLHPLRLMLRFEDPEAQMAAVLHDVVEDGDVKLEDLRILGIPESVVQAVDCLSRREGETYEAFIERIRPNALARRVKREDIRDNLDVTRLPELGEADLARVARYHRALVALEHPE